MKKVYRVLLKKKCLHCNKETDRYKRKTVVLSKKRVSFYVCLECGDPLGYNSYSHLFNELFCISKEKEKQPRVLVKTAKKKRRRVAGLEKGSYGLYLETKHWQGLRKRVLKKYPMCQVCRKHKAEQVHHLRYSDEDGKTILYREKMTDLLAVCRRCHQMIHI